MLTVCNEHIKEALQKLNVPHVKKIEANNHLCLFCKEKATIKLYYPIPVSLKKYFKRLHENDNYYQ